MNVVYLFLAYNDKKNLVYVGHFLTLEEAEKAWSTACGYNHNFLVRLCLGEAPSELVVLKYADRVSDLKWEDG